MTVTLQQFRDAWADKPNRDAAFALAEQYVAENAPTLEAIFGGKSSDEMVAIVSAARLANQPDVAEAATIWELVKFERKQIGGTVRTTPVNAPALREVNRG